MVDKYILTYSLPQVCVAWLAGLCLGGGALGLAAFYRHDWSAAFLAPVVFGAAYFIGSVAVFFADHWSDNK